LGFGNAISVSIKLREAPTILTLESYRANFCIFLSDSHDYKLCSKNDSIESPDKFKKLLNAIYVALKGDIYSSPDFGTTVDVSMTNHCVVLCISGSDQSKFRASILSFLRMIDLVYTTLLSTAD
jgi:tRNA threonylcarbamoyladenosine modification (KEOPS) complex  Pcc1 subunit